MCINKLHNKTPEAAAALWWVTMTLGMCVCARNVNVICLSRYFRSVCRSWRMCGHRLVYRLLGLQESVHSSRPGPLRDQVNPTAAHLPAGKWQALEDHSVSFAGRHGENEGPKMVIVSCWSGRQQRRVLFFSPSAGWPLAPPEVSSTAPPTGRDHYPIRQNNRTKWKIQHKHNLKMAFDERVWYFLPVVFKNWVLLCWRCYFSFYYDYFCTYFIFKISCTNT